ncbi:hypothetical protein E2562_028096 [Oryza meyeriana var. granulata]|uniref:Uncharacterized protein n=1 Tax=Oryza meyeriana var. granulata TaxID=110450 RepID=A0A6G1C8I9_9ORYZ|nr:hypothetical protein E2562_028096 [Oryza meyeriana var. granulata]
MELPTEEGRSSTMRESTQPTSSEATGRHLHAVTAPDHHQPWPSRQRQRRARLWVIVAEQEGSPPPTKPSSSQASHAAAAIPPRRCHTATMPPDPQAAAAFPACDLTRSAAPQLSSTQIQISLS